MQFSPDDADILKRIMRWRRDVRHFRPDPLPASAIDRLRAAMEHAPSVGNARPWRVLQVEQAKTRIAIKSEFERCNTMAAAAYADERQTAYRALKLAGLDVAPVQLAIFTETDPTEGHALGRQTMPETLSQSTAMAIYALMLAARAENLGVGMVSILEPARISEILKAPESWRFEAYLCIGRAEHQDDTPLLHRVGWQENAPPPWERR